jgi:hypothetical protein
MNCHRPCSSIPPPGVINRHRSAAYHASHGLRSRFLTYGMFFFLPPYAHSLARVPLSALQPLLSHTSASSEPPEATGEDIRIKQASNLGEENGENPCTGGEDPGHHALGSSLSRRQSRRVHQHWIPILRGWLALHFAGGGADLRQRRLLPAWSGGWRWSDYVRHRPLQRS